MPAGGPVAETLALGVCCVVAFAPIEPLFAGPLELLLCAGAVVVAFMAHGLALRWLPRRWPAGAVALLAVALWTVLTVCRDRTTARLPGPAAWRELWNGVTGGWSLVLTAGVPLDDRGPVAVLPVLAAGAVAVAAQRLQGAQRAVWPLVPPLLALVVTCGYAGHLGRSSPPLVIAVLVASVLTVLAARSGQRRDPVAGGTGVTGGTGVVGGRRFAAAGLGSTPLLVAVLTAVGVGVAAVGPLTDDGERFALRDLYGAPLVVRDAVSPLNQVSAELGAPSGGDRTVFRVTFEDIPEGTVIDRVSWAVLDRYDGGVWSNPARFDRAGRSLPAGWAAAPAGPTVQQRYDLPAGWSSSFVPVVGLPRRLGGADTSRFGYDGDTATLVAEGGGRITYELSSALPVQDRDDLLTEAVSADPRAAASAALPAELPPELGAFLAETTAAGDPPGVRLAALEAALRSERFGSSPQAAPGHSLGRLAAMLPTAGSPAGGAAPPEVQQVGTPEQFAGLFAVLGRLAGYPTRVVVGYRIDPAAATAGETIEVHAADITAWPEVLFERSGWVPYDPTNPTERQPQREADTGSDASVPASAPLETQEVKNCLELGTCLEVAGSGPAARTVAAAVALAVLAATPLALFAARVLQRARRRRGSPTQQVIGSWKTSRDRLRLAGLAIPPGTTVAEAAQLATDPVEGGVPLGGVLREALDELAPLVDAALFDPVGPAGDGPARARGCEQRIGRALATRSGLFARLRTGLDPRPLVWTARRPSAVPIGPVPAPDRAPSVLAGGERRWPR
ncbi:MAG: transglutaminase family protein [Acidimicrobiia bacterium]